MAIKLEDKKSGSGSYDTPGHQYSDPLDQISKAEEEAMEARGREGAEEDLKAKEESGGDASSSGSEKKNADKDDKSDSDKGIFGGDDKFSRDKFKNLGGKLRKNRTKAAVGGGVGVIVASMALFMLTAPGLELVRLSQILQRFHFSNHENATDDRASKLMRYIRNKGNNSVERTRLGVIGNRLADKVQADMKKNGLEPSYGRNFGYGEGYIIDKDNDRFKGMTDAEIKDDLMRQGFPEEVLNDPNRFKRMNGRLVIDTRGLPNKTLKNFNRIALSYNGYGKLTGAIGARVMGQRAGVNWHPLERAKRKAAESAEKRHERWKEKREQDVNNGTGNGNRTPGENDNKDADEARQEAEEAINDPDGQDSEAAKKLSSKILGKGVGPQVAVGIACSLRDLDKESGKFKYTNIILPAIRMGMLAIALGDQMRNGFDINFDDVAFYMALMHGVDEFGNRTSYTQAESIQAEQGGAGEKSVKASDTLKKIGKGTPFSKLNSGPQGAALGAGCGFLGLAEHIPGYGLVMGRAAAVLEPIMKPIMNQAMRWLAGKPINSLAAGASYGNIVNFGARLAANDQAISDGGTKLNPRQVAKLDAENREYENYLFNKRGLAERLFDPTDSRTFISQVLDKQSPDMGQNLASLASSVFKLPSLIFGNISSVFTASTSAAVNYDYGFDEYGYSSDDLELDYVADPYQNAEAAAAILDRERDGSGTKYIERAKNCFGVSLEEEAADEEADPVWAARGVGGQTINAYTDKEKDQYEGYNCNDRNEDWIRIRFFIIDSARMEALACYKSTNSNDESCVNIGMVSGGGAAATGACSVVDATAPPDDYSKTTFGGKTFNVRTKVMLEAAHKYMKDMGLTVPGTYTQGSYNPGGVANSASTHAGGGAFDVGTSIWGTQDRKLQALKAYRMAGFAAWIRLAGEAGKGSGEHIHGIAIGDTEAHQQAKDQVKDYFVGKNGLANHQADRYAENPGYPLPSWAKAYDESSGGPCAL